VVVVMEHTRRNGSLSLPDKNTEWPVDLNSPHDKWSISRKKPIRMVPQSDKPRPPLAWNLWHHFSFGITFQWQ